jgi:hypothetical protein
LRRPEALKVQPMTRFPLISLSAGTAVVTATDRYSRCSEPIQLPSMIHTKELTIWGYAA